MQFEPTTIFKDTVNMEVSKLELFALEDYLLQVAKTTKGPPLYTWVSTCPWGYLTRGYRTLDYQNPST